MLDGVSVHEPPISRSMGVIPQKLHLDLVVDAVDCRDAVKVTQMLVVVLVCSMKQEKCD